MRARPGWTLAALAPAAALATLAALTGTIPWLGRVSSVRAQPSAQSPVPQTDASLPASKVTMIGATPLEDPGAQETWGVGEAGSTTVLVRYAKEGGEGGWTLGPALPSGFELAKSPLAGQMTPGGAGALVGTVPSESAGRRKVVLVRKPGGAFAATAPIPTEGATSAGEEPLLRTGEELFGSTRAPMLAALQEAEGGAGVLVVPVREGAGVEQQVLHWNGSKWTSESIQIPAASKSEFRVLAIGASEAAGGESDAYLLAELASASYPAGAVALFRRVSEAAGQETKWIWKPVVAPGGKEGEAEPLSVPVLHEGAQPAAQPFSVRGAGATPTVTAQLLTVTGQGVWVDGIRADLQTLQPATTTLFFAPEGPLHGRVKASWCLLPSAAPVGTQQCDHQLPEALPEGPDRSVAWASGAEFGERVISGLPEGVSLSLLGDEFHRVLALGSSGGAGEDPGAQYGAAFTDRSEGWLGAGIMPVHLTREPVASRLVPWPTSFRHPLLAIAPQPGQPIGSLSSEALAVGDRGAVARFKPGVGWLPESLFGVGQEVEHPRLRAVAWPTPTRAFAVGDYSSEYSNMWLWRAETGMWEPDPAMPPSFRGNLLGIAFDPSNPAVGYAVGSNVIAGSEEGGQRTQAEGVLLRYGKTWTQETSLPSQVRGASFIGVAFAGSEAIVAYRRRLSSGSDRASGGLIVNDGSGWRLDEQADAEIGSAVPVSVAGLSDGGAAFATVSGPEGPRVYERESAGAPWQPTPAPLPGLTAGSLALFREAGALRAIVSAGGVANEGEPQSPPPGFPPSYLSPFPPVGGGPQSGGVLRQTARGWRDEGHELNPAGESAGGYIAHDLPYRPDPVLAVLVSPNGSEGWAMGGNINSANERLETADVERYPADGSTPLGLSASAISPEAPAHDRPGEVRDATFAIGGGAQCSAPCANRALAGVGPDVWLTTALAHAHEIAGVRAFLYAGPYVTAGKVNGPRSQPIPFAHELENYASILAASPLPVYAAIAPSELDARPEREGNESLFEQKLSSLPEPLGGGYGGGAPYPSGFSPAPGNPSEHEREECGGTTGCEAAYYAFDSTAPGGATVRIIVLDDSSDTDPRQIEWLEGQLASAKESRTPAIVVGNADLKAQIAAGDVQAMKLAPVLVGGAQACRSGANPPLCGASAYFYDAPEENVHAPLEVELEKKKYSIETFGSGTLGYVNVNNERYADFHGASGFLLAQVEMAGYEPTTNRAKVSVRLIPNVDELALEARGGILLRRSHTALFEGLARRPRAGGVSGEHTEETEVDPYIPLPQSAATCVGVRCQSAIFPEFSFSSSKADIGDFVKPNTEVGSPEAVLDNAKGLPEQEPVNQLTDAQEASQSNLFCAYNSGKTVVTISAGGLSASLPVTVEAGSVRQPCGTVPLKELPPAHESLSTSAPPPAPTPATAQPAPAGTTPPVPLPLPPPPPPLVPPIPQRVAVVPSPPFVPLVALAAPVLAFVPPPIPTPARPSPPTGTSAVTSPIEVAEKEEEEESATESVANQAVAYRAVEDEPASVYLLGVLALAALAGASIRRPRRGRRSFPVAPATITGSRAQRRLSARSRRR